MLTKQNEVLDDVQNLTTILKIINQSDITYLDSITDEMAHHQPIIMKLIEVHRQAGKREQIIEPILRNYIIIWEFFKVKGLAMKKPITEKHFESKVIEKMHFIRKLQSADDIDLETFCTNEISTMKHSILLFMVQKRLLKPAFSDLTVEDRMLLALEAKCLIECFSS